MRFDIQSATDLTTMFKPWIGANYDSATNRFRTLILGESHHSGGDLLEKTIECIEFQIAQNRPHCPYRFYTKLASCFVGRAPSLERKREFWNGVSYHNLITSILPASRVPPSPTQWVESLPTLPVILEKLKPNYVPVLGKRMWSRLSRLPLMREVPEIKGIGPYGLKLYGSVYFHGIKHPSSAFSPHEWGGYIESAKQQILSGISA